MKYEAVIGLEVHVQIKTRSKVFSRVAAGYGQEVNTLTDPVVLGLPGALPVMNKAALDAIIKAGLLLGCEIAPLCKWDRKNYFYPDSPKNYQISQYDQPICLGGQVEIELPGPARNVMGEHRQVPLTRIHLEEDVGKLNHFAHDSLVDYNRAGTPLMEIVSEPAMHEAEEAFAYLTSLRATMVYGGISDCDMEKGQLRCDANISIRPVGETKLGTKVELKNLNSISFVRDGIAHEIKRQIAIVTAGGTIVQETRQYDGEAGVSAAMRSKEMAHDYRYFPDPDLMPVKVDEAWKARLRAECPELPFDRQRRFFEQHQLPYTLTSVLIWDRDLADYYEEAAKLAGPGKAQAVANWIVNTLLRFLRAPRQVVEELIHESKSPQELMRAPVILSEVLVTSPKTSKLRPAHVAELVKLLDAGTVFPGSGKLILNEMMITGGRETPQAVAQRLELVGVTVETSELERWCRDAIAGNPKALADFKAGKDSAINGFKGAVMKAGKGKTDPKRVDETLRRLLAAQ